MAILDKNIIKIEGGLTNNPEDKGGLTKYGISQQQYPHLDIVNLTEEQALEIYYTDYWNPYHLSSIRNQAVADIIFYLIVNTDSRAAIKIVQRALVHVGMSIVVDGIIGAKTIRALNSCDPNWLIDAIRVSECRYYLAIVDANKTQKIFFQGWIRRALSWHTDIAVLHKTHSAAQVAVLTGGEYIMNDLRLIYDWYHDLIGLHWSITGTLAVAIFIIFIVKKKKKKWKIG
jgi:lysozyme family protein